MGADNKTKTERYLNALVAVSTCIVVMLVFDRMDAMLVPFASLELEATTVVVDVSGLSQNCTNVWESHRQKISGDKNNKWYSDYSSKPKYNNNNEDDGGFCARLPADFSAAHLWNEHLHWILEASSSTSSNTSMNIASHLLTSKLLQFLTPSNYLEQGHRSQPSSQAWGRLLQKINARIKSNEAPIVHVAAFGGGKANCEWNEGEGSEEEEKSNDNIDCLWPVRLEAFINTILNHGLQDGRPIVTITPMNHPPVPVTTEFDTAIVKHGLWNDYLTKHGGPDVIISAFGAQDTYLPKRGWNTAEDIEYYHHQRRIIQEFIRTCLELQPCSKSGVPKDPPLVINVDDYVGNQQGPVMADNTQARVLQLLSDYYETALVSYAAVIRKLVYASHNARSPLIHTSFTDWTKEWASLATTPDQKTTQHEIIEHGYLGPIAMTMTLAFSFLRYTVSYCSDQVAHKNSLEGKENPLLPQWVFRRAENVPPPELNKELCLSNVTQLWSKEQDQQTQRQEQCKANPGGEEESLSSSCPFAFWAGTHSTQQDLEQYITPFVQGDMSGWETRSGGRLVATSNGATLNLRFPALPTSNSSEWSIQLFSSFKDSSSSPSAKLEWELSAQGKRRRTARRHRRHLVHLDNGTSWSQRRILQQQQNSTNETKSGIIEASQDSQYNSTNETSGIIETTHDSPYKTAGIIEATRDSPYTVALPTTIRVDPSLEPSEVDLKLQLIDGDEFEIVAMMFCGGLNYSN